MGQLHLTLLDVRGRLLQEAVPVTLRHRTTSQVLTLKVPPGKAALVPNLYESPQGVYQVTVAPPSYRASSVFTNIGGSEDTPLDLVCAVNPAKVRELKLPIMVPAAAQHLLDCQNLQKLSPPLQAGFLNIVAKAAAVRFATRVADGVPVLSYFETLIEVREDRLFVGVSASLYETTVQSVTSGLFMPVSGSLHHMLGFDEVGSFKTPDRYGNLQLTFFRRGEEWRVDVDIDEAEGIEHLFQATYQETTHTLSNPYNIQQILLQYQKLDPLYDLIVS